MHHTPMPVNLAPPCAIHRFDKKLNDETSEAFASQILCDVRELMVDDEQDEEEEALKKHKKREGRRKRRRRECSCRILVDKRRKFNHLERNERVIIAHSSRVDRYEAKSQS